MNKKHILDSKEIPIIQSDRGGEVTYHGPGQIVIYFLLDIKRLNCGPNKLVETIQDFVKENPKSVLLDVRTNEEWDEIGKPDGDKIGIKTYFLSSQFQGRIINENFTKEFENLNIDKSYEVLVMCGSGNRSQRAAELLTEKGFKCLNVSDGFRGDGGDKIGWKNNQLPTK